MVSFIPLLYDFFTAIKSTQCNKSCASCRESFAHCNKTTGVCKSNCLRTKLCTRDNDLCLATWRWKNDRVVMFTSCFRLPPFSNSSQYSKKCKAAILNGTRTCLCQGSNCNKNPTEPVTENRKRVLSSENPKRLRQKREYSKYLCGESSPIVSKTHLERSLGPKCYSTFADRGGRFFKCTCQNSSHLLFGARLWFIMFG